MAQIMTRALALFVLVTSAISAHGAFSPVSVNIVPPIQFPPGDFTITGVRVSALYGRQRDIYGLDAGVLGNITELDFVGIGVSGVFNITHGSTTAVGLQAAGLFNLNTQKSTVLGIQLAAGWNENTAESSVIGFQIACANLSAHTAVYGLQVGAYNRARAVYGFQVGVINDADNLHGIQVGLVNYNRTGTLAVSPAINIGF